MSFLARLRKVAKRGPRRTAIESGSTRTTYGELVARAAVLGERLRALGVRPGDRVGLCFAKSPDYVIALLAVWHARAAFVPIDPRLPRRLRAFVVEDADLALVVAERGREALFEGMGVRVMPARAPTPRKRKRNPDDAPRGVPRPDDIAYVIYTSGTTGRPKGVVLPQRGIVNLLDAQIGAFRMDASSRSLLYLSTSFDASISDIGTTLLAGATLCIEPDAALAGAGLGRVLAERRISHLDLPPSLLGVLDPASLPASLRTVVIGGEPAEPELVRRWAARFLVVNVYGPTEATVCASLCRCDPVKWTRPLLGQPLPNVRWRVERGELLLGGIGLADGYRNLPELTRARFVTAKGERWYRTGDRVARRGREIEFLGRIDRQVKIRGQLVEPEGVEAELARHPGVAEAAVVKRATAAHRPVLIAFVVARAPAAPPRPADLAAHLRRTLPAWTIPHRIEWIDRLPRTVTGKVDLAALARRPLDPSSRRRGRAAASALEKSLARICGSVLGLPEVGATDDFYDDLGGDSLAVLGVVAAAEARGIALTPTIVSEQRTIAAMAARLGAAETTVMSAARLRADVDRDPRWRSSRRSLAVPRAPRSRGGADALLLTGGTGFLGSRLVAELLERTGARIHCLVRAADAAAGREALLRALRAHRSPRSMPDPARISVVCGDLSRERFGLPRRTWDRLTAETSAVYHSAARVDVVLPYRALRATNVGGAFEVLRFAAEGRPKILHHMSTLSVFVSTDRHTGTMRESDTLSATRRVHGGYAQSKWAAEHLLRSAPAGAPPVVFYRLGLLTGDTRTGLAAPNDLLSLFFRGLASLGSIPSGAGDALAVDVTPVDYAAAAVAHLSLGATAGTTFHIANPVSAKLPAVVEALRAVGVRITVEPNDTWRTRALATPAESAAWLALCRCLPRAGYARHRALDLFQSTGATFDRKNTIAGLAGSALSCPRPTPDLLRLYARISLAGEGFAREESRGK